MCGVCVVCTMCVCQCKITRTCVLCKRICVLFMCTIAFIHLDSHVLWFLAPAITACCSCRNRRAERLYTAIGAICVGGCVFCASAMSMTFMFDLCALCASVYKVKELRAVMLMRCFLLLCVSLALAAGASAGAPQAGDWVAAAGHEARQSKSGAQTLSDSEMGGHIAHNMRTWCGGRAWSRWELEVLIVCAWRAHVYICDKCMIYCYACRLCTNSTVLHAMSVFICTWSDWRLRQCDWWADDNDFHWEIAEGRLMFETNWSGRFYYICNIICTHACPPCSVHMHIHICSIHFSHFCLFIYLLFQFSHAGPCGEGGCCGNITAAPCAEWKHCVGCKSQGTGSARGFFAVAFSTRQGDSNNYTAVVGAAPYRYFVFVCVEKHSVCALLGFGPQNVQTQHWYFCAAVSLTW